MLRTTFPHFHSTFYLPRYAIPQFTDSVFNYYSQILVKPTWKNPIADVVVFVVENPPASVIRLADEIRRVFVPVEANLPQAGAVEITVLRISGDPPGTGSEADKT